MNTGCFEENAWADEQRATGRWRKTNEEFHHLYSSTNIITMMTSRRMKWARHVACVGRCTNNLLEKVKGDLGIDWVILLIWAFMNRVKNLRVLYVSENCLALWTPSEERLQHGVSLSSEMIKWRSRVRWILVLPVRTVFFMKTLSSLKMY